MDTKLLIEAIDALGAEMGKPLDLKPFESPIEEELYRVISKYVASDVRILNQIDIGTPNGRYRADFVLQAGDQQIVLECNGKEFHSELVDIYRGAFILGFSKIRSVYYIRGCDITYSLPTALYAISQLEPSFFSERGEHSLEALSEVNEGRGEVEYSDTLCQQIGFRGERFDWNEPRVAYRLTVLRRHGLDDKWKRIVSAALENPGITAKDFDAVFVRSPHYFIDGPRKRRA